jgi:hypothetical protein
MATVALATGALILRLAWEISTAPAAGSLVMLILLIAAAASVYGLIFYFIFTPGSKKIRSRQVAGWVTAIMTAAIIGAIIHYINFIPSPEASQTTSKIIATLLIAAGISGYALIVWAVWALWVKE